MSTSIARTTFALLFSLALISPAVAESSGRNFFESYKISAEDVLEVAVWKEEDLQRTVVVRPDGGITMPLIGSVQAAGLTTDELQSLLAEKIDTYVPDPVVTVSVTEIRGFKIYIVGEVSSPGEFLLGRYVDVLQALTMAGGLTPFANKSDIKILRREIGGEKIFRFNYNEVLKGKRLEQNIRLEPGDTIIAP